MTKALNQAVCPNCGSTLPKGSPEGLCPACLLEAADTADTQAAPNPPPKPFEPPSLEEVARLFPQLQILKLLGAGGMGAVYKARQPSLDRLVALKILPGGRAGGVNFAERFNREARALARLSHPSIVTVHEFGKAQDLHYFIMEFVDGANLRQLEKAGRLSPREALQIIPQICDALQYAHDEGVVHRDIKPENVLVDRKGRVKIADFGLAKILGLDTEQGRLTVEGQVMGTPHYMAPEQIERPLQVDHRADIYSLGVVFYEMLTGELPIGKFPPPSRKISVDVRLDEVVLRSLENDPSRRYQQASQVKTELQTISATPATTPATSLAPGEQPQAANASEQAPAPAERLVYWAGIPLAVDRAGEREIRWNGGLTAVGIGFLMIVLGMVVFRWVTGLPSPGLAGIPVLLMLLILGAGFRWVLHQPLPEPQQRLAPNGTVILQPARPRFDWGFVGLGAIAASVFAWGLLVTYGLPSIKQQIRASKAAQIAKLEPATGKFAAELPGRGRIELVALSYPHAAPNQWWRPNGTLIPDESWELRDMEAPHFQSASGLPITNRQMIVLFRNLPQGANGPFFDFYSEVGGSATGGSVFERMEARSDATGVLLTLEPRLNKLDMRVGLGLEPWRAIVKKDPRSDTTTNEGRPGDPNWEATFNSVSDTSNGAQVTVVMGSDSRAWHRRVLAVETNGTEHSVFSGQGTRREASDTWTYTFRELSLAQVREFRIEVQPVHWIAFRGIHLNPSAPLPAADRIRFGPAREFTVTDFIDFDTGTLTAEPPDPNDRNPFEGMARTVAWMERSGMDAAAGNGSLQPLGMTFVPLDRTAWDTLNPADLAAALRLNSFRPERLKPDRELPSSFGFRTREGGTGILQLLAFPADRPEVTLRYKLVQTSAGLPL